MTTKSKPVQRLKQQQKSAAIRGKYGPRRRPALVTIKTLDGGVVRTVDQSLLITARTYSEMLERLAKLAGYQSYYIYLKSEHWLKLRRCVLRRDRYRCVLCGSKKRLQVHHDRYTHLGNEPLKDLKTLCTTCHESIHA